MVKMSGNVFHILEIEPTNDKKEIRKAYARLVKRYHPEEYPEEWKRIHDAYETALKIAQYGKTPEQAKELPMQKQKAELPEVNSREVPPVVMKKPEPELFSPLKYPEPERKKAGGEDKSMPPKDADREEMDVLFRDIEKFSKEQQRQKAEEQKRELDAAVETLKQMAAKKRLNQNEWEAFFRREDMQPIICTGEFLYQLGECFNNRTISGKLHQFLLEQLILIGQYRKDKNITEDNAGVSDPLGYARSKIRSAGKVKRTIQDLRANAVVLVKALAWLLVAALSFTGMALKLGWWRVEKVPRNMYEEKSAAMQEFLDETKRINEEQTETGTAMMQGFVITGDTKEKMISVYGEPDIWQEYAEEPEYDEAVYHQPVYDLRFVLDHDIIIYIFYEERTEAD